MSAVRVSRYVFRRINGRIVPIRIGASRPPNAAIELAPPQKVKDLESWLLRIYYRQSDWVWQSSSKGLLVDLDGQLVVLKRALLGG